MLPPYLGRADTDIGCVVWNKNITDVVAASTFIRQKNVPRGGVVIEKLQFAMVSAGAQIVRADHQPVDFVDTGEREGGALPGRPGRFGELLNVAIEHRLHISHGVRRGAVV